MRSIGKLVSLALIVAVAPLLSACNQADQLCNWLWPTRQPVPVAEIPFEDGETQIRREPQLRELWYARYAVIEAQKKAPVERLIIEGHFTGDANPDNTRRAEKRAAATKDWLQRYGGLNLTMDARVGAFGENKRVAKILIDKKAAPTDSPQVLKDIEFSRNSSQVANKDPLLEAWYEIRDDVQKKGFARLVIQGNAARSEKNASTMAETRATAVKHWFEARKPPIPNLQLSERPGQENKSVVRLIIERERIPRAAASIPLCR